MKKRILSLVLCVVILMGLLPVVADTSSKVATAVTVTVDMRTALIGEELTWTMNIDPDGGNYQTRIKVFANGTMVYNGDFTSDPSRMHSYTARVAGPHYAQAIAYDNADGVSLSVNSLVTTVKLHTAPAITSLVNVKGRSVRVSWTEEYAVTGGYKVLYATAVGGPYQLGGTTSALTHTVTGLNPGARYYFKVSGYNYVGGNISDVTAQSAYKTIVLVGTAAISTIASTITGQIKLTWNKSAGATAYGVYRATSPTGTYKNIKYTAALSFVDKGLVSGTTYYYKLRPYCRVSTDTIFYGPFSGYKGIAAK